MKYSFAAAISILMAALLPGLPALAESCDAAPGKFHPVPIQATQSAPPYPPLSRRLGEQGVTELLINVKSDGSPASATVHKTSGSIRLDTATLDAAKNWKWQPFPKGCPLTSVSTTVAIAWHLTSASALSPAEDLKHRLASELLIATNFNQTVQGGVILAWATTLEEFYKEIPSGSDTERKRAIDAINHPLFVMYHHQLEAIRDGIIQRLTEEIDAASLQSMVSFYEGPIGRKSAFNPGTLTSEERRAMGEFILKTPAAMKLVSIEFGVAKEHPIRNPGGPQVSAGEVRHQICEGLGPTAANYSACANGR